MKNYFFNCSRLLSDSLSKQYNGKSSKLFQLINSSQFPITSSLTNNLKFFSSRQKIIQNLQQYQNQLGFNKSQQLLKQQQLSSQTQSKTVHQTDSIVKDFIELTETSFNEHLVSRFQNNEQVDPHLLLMILSSLDSKKIVKEHLPRLYNFLNIFDKQELLLMYELIVSFKPPKLPHLVPISRNLEGIQTILLLLNQIHSPQQLIDWLKQIPVYSGQNLYMVCAGFFAIYQKMEQTEIFRQQSLIKKIIHRTIILSQKQTQQEKASLIILALQSPQTADFGQQLLMQFQIDFDELDPLKLQLLYLSIQQHIIREYSEIRKQAKRKSKYKVVEQDSEGQIVSRQQVHYDQSSRQYSMMQQIQKYEFLQNICKRLIKDILDLDWSQTMKLNILLEYWKILDKLQLHNPWARLTQRIISHTNDQDIMATLTNLQPKQVIMILETMRRMKLNKPLLLQKCLIIISDKLQVIEKKQMIKICRICVTYVRQCEDYLIGVRKIIEKKRFIYTDEEINQLNEIFKRVLILFPNPLVK